MPSNNCAVPGLGVDSAQQIIAEVGAQAMTFPFCQASGFLGAELCLEMGKRRGIQKTHRSPSGNRQVRRILNQAANAAAKSKGGPFSRLPYPGLVSRLGHNQTIGAIAHRLVTCGWIILHRGVAYEERGPVNARSKQKRTSRMIRELRLLGYRVEPAATPA